ncbi:Ribosome maturation factor RimM [Pseudoclavibacter triregionum]|nr:Ribosome maturation factor RimM [Pseudoclavibacter triregionum]
MAPRQSGITQLRVGRLTKAHGLKGALKIELYTDEPERRFTPGASFSLQVLPDSPWHGKSIELRELRWYNGHPVGFFEGVDDRTAAETLAKAILWVDQDDAEELEPDTWYDHQLVGLDVVVDGETVGTVARVDHLPAQDLIVVSTSGEDVLVPFVRAIVPTVDLEAGRIVMTPPTGLFDPDAAEVARDTSAPTADAELAEAAEAEPAEQPAASDDEGADAPAEA